jgi:hypothetical protein
MKRITTEARMRLMGMRKMKIIPEEKHTSDKSNVEDKKGNPQEEVIDSSKVFIKIESPRERTEINKWERITGKDTIFISFISNPIGSNFYTECAKNLINSLSDLGYDYCVVEFPSDRNYYQNCCFKPTFIENKIKEFNKNVVWIDIDTELKRSMDQFINVEKDFDIGLVTYNNDMSGIVASPLFIRNTPMCTDLIKKWSDHCLEKLELGFCELDHDALKHVVLPLFRSTIKIKLNWDNDNSMHKGSIINNVNSDTPLKNLILAEMRIINRHRPCNYRNNDYIIIYE